MGIGQIAIVIGSGIIGSLAINSDGNLPGFRDILSFSFKFMKQDKKDGASATNPHTDQLLSQVNHLREQLHLLAHSNQVSIVNVDGRPGPGAYGITALVVGAIGYLYIRWKGWKIADMMFVTKRGLNDACNTVGKQLDQVSENVNASKRHLSGRIDRVDCNLDECQEIIEATGKEVTVIHGDLSAFQQEIQSVHLVVRTLETKLGRLAYTQDHTTRGIHELCEFTKRLDRSPKADTRQIASSTPRPAIESSEAINRTSSAPLGLEPESPAAQSSKTEAPKVLLSSNTISASGLSMLAETSMPPRRGVISRTTMKEGSSELSSGASSSTMKKPAPSSSRFGFLRGFAS